MLQQKSKISAHPSKRQTGKTSKEFRKFFLLQFTRELIKHSAPSEVFELESVLKEKAEESKEKIKKIIKAKKEKVEVPVKLSIQKQELFIPAPILKKKEKLRVPNIKPFPRVLRVPKPRVPPRFQYLRPSPTTTQIDLEKLNSLINDPVINTIECNGPDINIIVRGTMGTKKTNIILNTEEINRVIKKFSEKAKIPIQEGIFKVAVGKLILTAIISGVVSSRFIIKKMMYNPAPIFKR